jgi:hypothetical protein
MKSVSYLVGQSRYLVLRVAQIIKYIYCESIHLATYLKSKLVFDPRIESFCFKRNLDKWTRKYKKDYVKVIEISQEN